MRHFFIAITIALLLAACGGKPSSGDMKQQYQTAELPGLLELKSFKLEDMRNIGSEDSPVWLSRYTATVSPREDTYELQEVLEGRRLLKPVHAGGEKFAIYGTVRARRMGKEWHYAFQSDGSSNPVIGRPRADYGPDALVAGSTEARELLSRVEGEREKQRLEQETRLAAEAAERRTREEAEAALRKRIEDAVARHGAEFAPETLGRIGLDRNEHVGKTYHFLVRNLDPTGNKTAWGSDVYSCDSNFAKVVAHAGLLEPGETGIVSATMLGNHRRFAGSPRNGVNTESHSGEYRAYRVALVERISDAAAGTP